MSQRSQVIIWLSILSTSIWLLPCTLATTLVWPDAPNGRLYRIDVEKRILEAETAPMVWQKLGAVQMNDIQADAFPPSTRVTCLNSGNSRFRYLLVDCTQQVYRFDTQTRMLERLDKTYFRGYNCNSAKFLRRDTLYSFGGYGFWHTNNIQSYYKAASQEWESLNPSANAPPAIHRGFNGYLPERDIFFSALSLRQSDSENRGAFTWTDSVYAYSFNQKTWTRLGRLSAEFRQYLTNDRLQKVSWFQAGRYFMLGYYESPHTYFLLVDPVRNESRIWKDTRKTLANPGEPLESDIERRYIWGNNLYFRRNMSGATGPAIRSTTLSVNDLWKNSTLIGPLYVPISASVNSWLYGMAVAAFVLLAGLITRFKIAGKLNVNSTVDQPVVFDAALPDGLNDQERDVFNALLKTADSGGLNAEQVNDILAIGDKSPDNQRKIRADVIKGLNLKLNLLWGIEEAIERVPTALDRRMFTYTFNSDVKARVGTSPTSHEDGKLTL